jgi:hypothetical protein
VKKVLMMENVVHCYGHLLPHLSKKLDVPFPVGMLA